MKFLFTLFKRKNEYKLEDVFTPTSSADISYISRPDVEKKIEKAIDIPGKQVVIYGHSGSGKTTVLKHIIRQKNLNILLQVVQLHRPLRP